MSSSGQASLLAELGPISPELAMVDPVLRRRGLDVLEGQSADLRPRGDGCWAPPARARPPILETTAQTGRMRSRSLRAIARSKREAILVLGTVVVSLATLLGAGRPFAASAQRQALPEDTMPSPSAALQPAPRIGRALSEGVQPTRRLAPRTFSWVPARGAAAYEFILFRGQLRVLVKRVRAPRVTVPATWRYGGSTHSLRKGSYRWVVIAVGRSGKLAPEAIVASRLVVG